MKRTVNALTDLCTLDEQLSAKRALGNDSDLPGLEQRRAALRVLIPASSLAAYDALCRLRRRPAVVELRRAHCGGCHLRVPPQLDAFLRRGQSLCACPHCRRLLYMPLAPKEIEIRVESPDESGVPPALDLRNSKRTRAGSARRPARTGTRAAKKREFAANIHRARKASRPSDGARLRSLHSASGHAKSATG